MKNAIYEFWVFGLKQAYACIFAGLFLSVIIITHFYYPFSFIYRYDFLFLSAIAIQLCLLVTKLETAKEFYAIIIFHVIATLMEVFKTQVGSWNYPDQSQIKITNIMLAKNAFGMCLTQHLAQM